MKHTRDSQRHQHGTATAQVVCAVCFLVFTACWLYFFQADVMAVAQHVLSGGQTHYNRTAGTLIITSLLWALQIVIARLTGLRRRSHALTYLPSMLMLAFLSDVPSDIDRQPTGFGLWPWAAAVVLALWGVAIWLARQIDPFARDGKEQSGLFSRRTWINTGTMALMMLGVACVGNTNAVFHYAAHAEAALTRGHTDEALRTGQRSLETDESLTMLRALALSQKGELGERLFDYAVSGTGADLLPMHGSHSRLRMMPDSLLWQHLGLSPDSVLQRADSATLVGVGLTNYAQSTMSRLASRLSTEQYLQLLDRDSLTRAFSRGSVEADSVRQTRHRLPPYCDYRLCGLLIDRRLDDFVRLLADYYPIVADSLPRHYREALVLYQLSDTLLAYADTLQAQRLQEFLATDTLYPSKSERLIRTEQDFGHTYWYYHLALPPGARRVK